MSTNGKITDPASWPSLEPAQLLELLQQQHSALECSVRERQTLESEAAARRKAEEELRASEERLKLALEATRDGLWDWDLATGETHWSSRWFTMRGLRPGDLDPRREHWESLIHPDDREQAVRALEEHLAGRTEEFCAEYRVRSASGECVWVLDRGRVVARDAAGKPLRVVGTSTDITERKRAEDERRRLEAQFQQVQKLESLGVLTGGIAHDFNNLLMAISGNAELAAARLPADAPAAANLRRIMEATERAANLTRQMLAYVGRGKFVLLPCDLSEVIRAMASLLASSVSKKCALRYELAAGLPPLRADAGQLQQMVLNLVANASEALEEREGQVTLRTGTVACRPEELSLLRPDPQAAEYPCVFIEVEDTGYGIKPGLQDRIFDPFFSTKFIGRGLGLPAVLGIVRRHQGAIKVRSEPDHGSVFRVLLPVAPPPVAETAKGAPAARETGETVLVVDDEDSVRALARNALEAIGCTVLEAGDGAEALTVFRAHAGEIRLVLLDLAMPRLDGTEALRELRRLNPDVRVILNSGYEMDTPPPLPPGTGAVEFLQKPYRLEMLWDAVRRNLGR